MDGSIIADFITAGTMLADRIRGGTLKIGGINNIDGIIEVVDRSNNLLVKIDTNGITLANGSKLIGGAGVLSQFQFGEYNWYWVGYFTDNPTSTNYADVINIPINLPDNFVVTQAKVAIKHSPIYYDITEMGSGANFWGYCRNIKLYQNTDTEGYYETVRLGSEGAESNPLYTDEITGAFGTNGFTAKTPSDNNHVVEEKESINIVSFIEGKKNFTLQLRSSNAIPSFNPNIPSVFPTYQKNCLQQTGNMKAVVNIIGYVQ